MGRQPGSKTRLLCRQIRRFHIRRTGSWGYPGSIFASVFLLKEVENLKGVNSFMICQRRWLLKKFLLLSMKLPLVCELLMMTYFSGVCFEFEVKWSKRCVFVFVFFLVLVGALGPGTESVGCLELLPTQGLAPSWAYKAGENQDLGRQRGQRCSEWSLLPGGHRTLWQGRWRCARGQDLASQTVV